MQGCLLSIEAQDKLAFICCSVKKARTIEDAKRNAWGAAISVGALPPEHAGKSMTSISDDMGLTRAAVSKKARSFCTRFGIPPSHYMKAESASKSFRNARIRFIMKSQTESVLAQP